MECADGFAIACAKAEMHSPRRCNAARFRSDRELHAELSGHRAVVGSAMLEVERAHEAERPQHRIIKTPAPLDLAYSKRNMIQHFLSSSRFGVASFARQHASWAKGSRD
jgi:hypothetical protein